MRTSTASCPQQQATLALEIEGLEKIYRGDKQVLRGLSLRVEQGQTLGFVGPNGSGKTSCLRSIMGLVFPDRGSIRVAGIDAVSQAVEVRKRVGYLPGENSVYRWMTGSEFLRFGLGFHDEVDTDFVARCLARFEVPIERPLRSYSSGQKQMLSLTIALAPIVPLYVLDEPEKALDASKRQLLRELLHELGSKGRSLIISSHHISELEQFADDFAFLLDGRIVPEQQIAERREMLARRIRVRFEGPQEAQSLPPGTTVREHEQDWLLQLPPDCDPRQVARSLLAQNPARLEVGEATLQELYESIYLESTAG